MRKLAAGLALAAILVLTGCPNTPIEKAAYRTIVGAKAFTDSMKQSHPECASSTSTSVCANLTKAIAAKDTLIDATEVYCSGPQFESGGVCQPPTDKDKAQQAHDKLQAAMDNYNQAEKDVKGAIK